MEPEERFFQRTFLRKAFSNFRAEMQTAQGTAADKREGKAASDGLGLHLVAVDSVRLALAIHTQSVRRFAPCGVTLFGATEVSSVSSAQPEKVTVPPTIRRVTKLGFRRLVMKHNSKIQ